MTSAIWTGLLGGAIMGVAATMLLVMNGRIAGVSGILGGVIDGEKNDRLWRLLFVAGLFVGGLLMAIMWPARAHVVVTSGVPTLVIAGLLVGFGSRLGSGCTSGHGVCGLARLSTRSLVATMVFMAAGFVTVFVMKHLF